MDGKFTQQRSLRNHFLTQKNRSLESQKVCLVQWLLMLACFAASSNAWGNLAWDKKMLYFSPSATESQVEAHFKFTNVGTDKVTVRQIKTSCGCTTALADKKAYGVGESGEIIATFKFEHRVGPQEKKIIVETDNLKDSKTELTLRVTIPVPLQIYPSIVFWRSDEELIPKILQLNAINDFEIASLKVISGDEKIAVKTKAVETGKRYEISVSPRENQRNVAAILKIIINDGRKNAKVYLAHVRVN